jgi:L-threonylcarbamoyladenylate synthase
MRYITILGGEDRREALSEAARAVKAGGIVACPTETYYALCARYDSEETLKYLFDLKGRAADKPFPLIIGSAEALHLVTDEINDTSIRLMEKFWPGPLTLLFRAKKGASFSRFIVSGGKVAVRVPGESFALSLARLAGMPLTATSANISGMPPARTAEEAMGYFDARIELLIDEGRPAPGGEPSTIVDTGGGRVEIIREGAVSSHQILSTYGLR